MAVVTLPNTITDDTAAEAADVQENDEALRDGINNIAAAQIGAGEVNAAALADGAVVAAKIGTGAVENAKLASDAVTAVKILDGTITAAKMAAAFQVSVQADDDISALANAASDFKDFGNMDTTLFPQVTVYQDHATPTYWQIVDPALVAVVVFVAGANWRVTVTNSTGSTHDFKIVVTGTAA